MIPMLSHNSFEMEVNSREWAYGRDMTATGMVGDGEIFAAGSFVLCCHGLNICRQEAAGPCSPWQGEVRLQKVQFACTLHGNGRLLELLEQFCIRLCWFKRALK